MCMYQQYFTQCSLEHLESLCPANAPEDQDRSVRPVHADQKGRRDVHACGVRLPDVLSNDRFRLSTRKARPKLPDVQMKVIGKEFEERGVKTVLVAEQKRVHLIPALLPAGTLNGFASCGRERMHRLERKVSPHVVNRPGYDELRQYPWGRLTGIVS